jgi:hypothetical protein
VATVLSRGVLVVVAVVAAAWLALSYRGVALESDGQDLIVRAQKVGITDAELRHGQEQLADAREFRADTNSLLLQGQLEFAAHHNAASARTARRLTDGEPENVDGWFLAYFAAGTDPARKREALSQVRRLNPWLADGLR